MFEKKFNHNLERMNELHNIQLDIIYQLLLEFPLHEKKDTKTNQYLENLIKLNKLQLNIIDQLLKQCHLNIVCNSNNIIKNK